MMDPTTKGATPSTRAPTKYTGVITELRTVTKKEAGASTFQSFRLISSAHKNQPEFTIGQLPDGIQEGTTVDIEATVTKYPWQRRGKTLFSFDRRVVSIRAT